MLTLTKREKSILIVVAFVIFTSLITWGLYVLYRKLVTPPCPEGQKRYSEFGNSCFPDCAADGKEICPKKDDKGNTQISCVKKCTDGTTFNKGSCNDPKGYCEKTCPTGTESVMTTSGWDCGIPCAYGNDDGFPDNYCSTEDKCGRFRDGTAAGTTHKGCLSNSYERCDPNSDYYCQDKNNCTKATDGGYYCGVPMCLAPNSSVCSRNNDCSIGKTCTPLPKTDMRNMDSNVGTCSKLQELASNPLCCMPENIGESGDGTLACCTGKGIKMSDLQCDSFLTKTQAGTITPCCEYGLCNNGWQCKGPGADAESMCFQTVPGGPASPPKGWKPTCCDNTDQAYKVGEQNMCCPQSLTPGPANTKICLNTTTSPIDPSWVPDLGKCTADTDCTNNGQEKLVSGHLPQIQWTEPTKATFGTIYCDTSAKGGGQCRLGCGYRDSTLPDGTVGPSPFKTLTIPNSKVAGETLSRCYQPTTTLAINGPITMEYPGPTHDFQTPTLLCNDTNITNGNPYWNGSALQSGTESEYHNGINYTINSSDSSLCPVALNLTGASHYAGTGINDNDLNGTTSTLQVSGTPNSQGSTDCKARLDCNLSKSTFGNPPRPGPSPSPPPTLGVGDTLTNWYTPNTTQTVPAAAVPKGINNMVNRVSKILKPTDKWKGGCNPLSPPTKPEDCNLGINPQGFTSEQTTSPCFYIAGGGTIQPTCNYKNITGSPKDSDINYSGSQPVSGGSIYCSAEDISANRCLPRLLASGEFCSKGTHNGIDCL